MLLDKFRNRDGSFKWSTLSAIAGNAFFALAVMYGVCLIAHPAFENPQTIMMIVRQVTCVGIIALGMTYVIAGGGIDLSVGALFAFCGVVSVRVLMYLQNAPGLLPESLCTTNGGAFALICIISLLTGAAGGALNGFLVTVCRIPPFITTLGTLSIFRSLALHLADSGTLSLFDLPRKVSITGIADRNFGIVPAAAVVLVVITALAAFVMRKTAYGHHLCAVGANVKAAKFAGVRTSFVSFLSYVIVGVCVGTAMVLFLGQFDSVSSSNAGNLYELDAIAAAVIGGTAMSGGRASLWGTLAGALILGLIFALLNILSTVPDLKDSALLSLLASPTLKDLVKGIIILFSVFIQRKEKI
ncbi:MAG: ABC transporter permease [Lentisphaeria bacterium]|nr:ABC transporter permease [Lentisphaeria bacterium]